MKRIRPILLLLLAALFLAACGGQKLEEINRQIGELSFADESILTKSEKGALEALRFRREQALSKKDAKELQAVLEEWNAFKEPIAAYIAEFENLKKGFMQDKSLLTAEEAEWFTQAEEALTAAFSSRNKEEMESAKAAYNSEAANALRELLADYASIDQKPFKNTELNLMSAEDKTQFQTLINDTNQALLNRDAEGMKDLMSRWSGFVSRVKSSTAKSQDDLIQEWIKASNFTSSLSNLLSLGQVQQNTTVKGHQITITAQYNTESVTDAQIKSGMDTYMNMMSSTLQNGVDQMANYVEDVSIRVEYYNAKNTLVASKTLSPSAGKSPAAVWTPSYPDKQVPAKGMDLTAAYDPRQNPGGSPAEPATTASDRTTEPASATMPAATEPATTTAPATTAAPKTTAAPTTTAAPKTTIDTGKEIEPNDTQDKANRILLNEEYSGNLKDTYSNGERDWYRFVNEKEGVLVIHFHTKNQGSDTAYWDIRLKDSNAEDIWQAYVKGNTPDIQSSYQIPLGVGIHYFAVESSSAHTKDPYSFELEYREYQELRVAKPDSKSLTVEPLKENTTSFAEAEIRRWNGNFSADGQLDKYSFTPPWDGVYSFFFTDILEGQGYPIRILNGAGESIHNDSMRYEYGLNGGFSISLSGGQSYTVETRQNKNYKGSYCLNMGIQKETQDISSFTAIGDSVEFLEQTNSYHFTPSLTGDYRFGISNALEGNEFAIRVLNPVGDGIHNSNWNYAYGNGGGFTVSLTAGQQYTVQVRQCKKYYGAYDLNCGVIKESGDISGAFQVQDSIQLNGQTNIYSFLPALSGEYGFGISQAMEGHEFRIQVRNAAGDAISNGNWNYSYGNGNAQRVNLTAGQNYTVLIRSADASAGSYTLNIGNHKAEQTFDGYDRIRDSMDYWMQENSYSFTSPYTGQYRFTLSDMQEGGSVKMQLRNASGDAISNSNWNYSYANGDYTEVDLTEGQRYTVIIRQNGSYQGNYLLTLRMPADAVLGKPAEKIPETEPPTEPATEAPTEAPTEPATEPACPGPHPQASQIDVGLSFPVDDPLHILLPVLHETDPLPAAVPLTSLKYADIEVGMVVTFGSYEQDNDLENGEEDVEWIVYWKGETNIYLISRYVLDALPFASDGSTTYDGSYLDKWLQGDSNSFMEKAFTNMERSFLAEQELDATKNESYPKTPQTPLQYRKVRLFSLNEIRDYLPEEYLLAAGTPYALSRGLAEEANGCSAWWTRTMGRNADYAGIVSAFGELDYSGMPVTSGSIGVRPVISFKNDTFR